MLFSSESAYFIIKTASLQQPRTFAPNCHKYFQFACEEGFAYIVILGTAGKFPHDF